MHIRLTVAFVPRDCVRKKKKKRGKTICVLSTCSVIWSFVSRVYVVLGLLTRLIIGGVHNVSCGLSGKEKHTHTGSMEMGAGRKRGVKRNRKITILLSCILQVQWRGTDRVMFTRMPS